MKKILKSRIFIMIITMIICISGTLYATTKYQASEILYIPSDGSGEIDVNEALNELYNNMGKCSVTDKFRLGDYVQMTPTSTSYTILSSLTGYTADQTINPSELNLWRIIKINENGTMEIISENVSSTGVYFKGQTGYLNLVGALNEIASQYENSNYTIGSRIMGYNGQTEYITDTSKFTTTAPWTYSTKDNSNETLGGGDFMYLADTNLVTEVLGTLVATNQSGNVSNYWLGSRIYLYGNDNYYYWRGRLVKTNGSIDCDYLYNRHGGSSWYTDASSAAIRPILTLKSGLTVTGSGTRVDPWVLQ